MDLIWKNSYQLVTFLACTLKPLSPEEIKAISRRTSKQSDDDSGEWESQRHGRLTASNFGDVCKRKEATKLALLTKRLLYGKKVNTKAMRYGMSNESQARRHYTDYIQNMSPDAKVEITGFHINQNDCWLGASPDGLVYDPISTDPHGLLEIKCPSRAEDTSLFFFPFLVFSLSFKRFFSKPPYFKRFRRIMGVA